MQNLWEKVQATHLKTAFEERPQTNQVQNLRGNFSRSIRSETVSSYIFGSLIILFFIIKNFTYLQAFFEATF